MFLIRIFTLILGLFSIATSWSFTCYYTLAKDSCWTKFNVSVDVMDAAEEKKIMTVPVPAGTPWVRQAFECNPKQGLHFIAQFSPVFWEGDKGKKYQGSRNWFLPEEIHSGAKAWTISLCFPTDFLEVPLPPKADSQCKCDFTVIPEVKLN